MDDLSAILTRLGVMDNRLENIEKHLDRQNGRVSVIEVKCGEIDKRLVGMETRCLVSTHQDDKEHARIDNQVKENRDRVIGLIGQYGAIILSVLMLLNMIGGWVGWW